MTPFELLYYAAAAWTIAYAIVNTSGPGGVFENVREWQDGRWHGRISVHGTRQSDTEPLTYETEILAYGLLDCIICLMPWMALLLRLIGANIVTDALAIAGIGLWAHGYFSWRHNIS